MICSHIKISDAELTMTTGFEDLTGRVFTRLTVLSHWGRTADRLHRWNCRCECGKELVVAGKYLRSGRSKSCGCYKADRLRSITLKHGMTRTPEAYAYSNAVKRVTTNWRDGAYTRRGISMCDRWLHGENGKSGFECFLDDMGPRPGPEYSLDRMDNDGNYEPGNCRWATIEEQANNKTNNRMVEYGGEVMTLTQAWRLSGNIVPWKTAWYRVSAGWTAQQALEIPLGVRR